jgi:uridine kinase
VSGVSSGATRPESYRDLAESVVRLPARLGGTRLVAIDGPSGAGKTVFAQRLAGALEEVTGASPPVVNTDDLLAGWADQVTFWSRLEEWVLGPLRAGRSGHYRRYDWHTGRFGTEWTSVPPAPVVLLEGVTAARAAIRPELSLSVFLTAPPGLCLERTLARDGEALRPYLEIWQRGEERHFAADATAHQADLLIDGAPATPFDAEREYVRLCRPAIQR